MYKSISTASLIFILLNIFQAIVRKASAGEVEIGSFRKEYDAGEFPHVVYSGPITLLDERRAKLVDFEYLHQGPYAYWSARLRTAPTGNRWPLDQLGNYRDNIILSATGTEPCNLATGTRGAKTTVIVTLPEGHTWEDVAWFGVTCYGYMYVFNFVWVNPTIDETGLESDKKFDLPKFEAKPDDVPYCAEKVTKCENSEFDSPKPCYRDCEDFGDCGKNFRNGADAEHQTTYGCSGRPTAAEVRPGEECDGADG